MAVPLDVRLGRVAARQLGLITNAQALKAGASRGLIGHRLRTGAWKQVHRGVYRLGSAPVHWEQSVLAACLAGGDDAVASHLAAAALWKLPGFDPGAVEISVSRERRCRLDGPRIHHSSSLETKDRTRLGVIPVTTPTRTLIDIATVKPPDVIEDALDFALNTRLITWSRLLRRLAELEGRPVPGSGALRALLRVRGGDDPARQSVLETPKGPEVERPSGSQEPVSNPGRKQTIRPRLRVPGGETGNRGRRVPLSRRAEDLGGGPKEGQRTDPLRLEGSSIQLVGSGGGPGRSGRYDCSSLGSVTETHPEGAKPTQLLRLDQALR